MKSFHDMSIATKVNVVLSSVIVILLSAMMLLVSSYLTRTLEERSLNELTKTNQLALNMIDAYNHSLEQSAEKLGNVFASNFLGKFKLDEGSTIVIVTYAASNSLTWTKSNVLKLRNASTFTR